MTAKEAYSNLSDLECQEITDLLNASGYKPSNQVSQSTSLAEQEWKDKVNQLGDI